MGMIEIAKATMEKRRQHIYLVGHDAALEITFSASHTIVHEFHTFALMRSQNIANDRINDHMNQNL